MQSVTVRRICCAPRHQRNGRKLPGSSMRDGNFPHTFGALDGKHVATKCHCSGGSRYYNYNGFNSFLLMAFVDAEYKFLNMDIGAHDCSSDGGVFHDIPLREAVESNCDGMPDLEPLPNDDNPLLFFIMRDDAFVLWPWMIKPYPHWNMSMEDRIFNYRLSRACRVIENAFGIIANK